MPIRHCRGTLCGLCESRIVENVNFVREQTTYNSNKVFHKDALCNSDENRAFEVQASICSRRQFVKIKKARTNVVWVSRFHLGNG